MSNRKRSLVFVLVAGVHALALGGLFSASRVVRLLAPGDASITAFIVMPLVHLRSPIARPQLETGATPLAPIVEPITLPLPASASAITTPGGRAVDWEAAVGQSAAAALEHHKRISFGFPAGGKSAITLGVPSPSTPAHYAGESDRTVSGQDTEWTSDRCYVVSDPPLPDEPDFLKHARISHFGCLPPAGPDPGELFKSLPAYKKHHPH
jgi:hypothetical protein